jgi:hypothetical protein
MDTPDLSAFGKFVPGFEFLQNLTRQTAGGAAPGVSTGLPGMPPLSHWVAPTFDVEELDKRIQDLRAVHFWLDQNAKALGATIQALEVQKMTLATLKGMNVSLQEVAESFKMPVPPAAPAGPPVTARAPEPATPEAAPDAGKADDAPAVDPMNWWNALTQQFQAIASTAMQDMAEHANRAAAEVKQAVANTAAASGPAKSGTARTATQTGKAAAVRKPTAAKTTAAKPASKKAPSRSTR